MLIEFKLLNILINLWFVVFAHNPLVDSSSLSGPTKYIKHLGAILLGAFYF